MAHGKRCWAWSSAPQGALAAGGPDPGEGRGAAAGRGVVFRITHIDVAGHRHCLSVRGQSRDLAMHFVEQLYGEARAMSAIRVSTGRPGWSA